MDNQAYSVNFKRVGQDVVIWPLTKIISPGVISLGDSVIVDDFVFLMGGVETTIGSFVHIASFTSITGGGRLIMDDFTTLSSGVRVFTGTDDFSGSCLTNSTIPYPFRQPFRSSVRIKKHAIIGANTVVLPGIVVGEGVAVGANSLVNKDCEPWTIQVGSPARPMKSRPRERILSLEAELKSRFYDKEGRYIPNRERLGP